MSWLVANWTWLVPTVVLVAEKVAVLTPSDFEVFGVPVGKYDDVVVSAIKKAMAKK